MGSASPSKSAEDAVSAARAAHENLGQAKDPLKIRIGIHTGSIKPTGDDYFGPPVNKTSRILNAAHGGQTLISESTKALLPKDVLTKDLGSHVLRDLLEPTRIWQLGIGNFAGIKSVSSVPNNLPFQTTSFIGREDDRLRLAELAKRSRLITLTGTGGTGKSRLSLQFAADNLDQYEDGVWFCELALLFEEHDVLRAVADAVKAPEIDGSLEDRLVVFFAGKQALLILDNCEQVLDAASKIAELLIGACPNLSVVATSRERLGARGETAFRVPSLPCPDPARRPTIDDLDHYGSTALFVDRLRVAAPEYRLQPNEALTVSKICQRLDGIPLAIELAAARGRAMTLETIEKRLDDRFRLLTGGSRNALSRQQTLRALIDWSVQLLNETDALFFISLSVFAGSWDIDAAEAICSAAPGSPDPVEVLDLLTTLVDKSLVVFERERNRYRMLETMRQYALERLQNEPAALIYRDAHADFYLRKDRLESLDERASNNYDVLADFACDYENFRQAVDWKAGKKDGLEQALFALTRASVGFNSLDAPMSCLGSWNRLSSELAKS